jgi:DNA-binding SARP family transcriptional activator
VAPNEVRLELLDGFRLTVAGVPIDPLVSAQRLLAFLALRGPVARAVAAGTLWGDAPDGLAMGSLRTAIWRCNRVVPQLVAAHRGQVALADFVRVDVAELVDGTAFAPSRPVRGGELLPGWYDDWVTFERERLRHVRLHGLEAAARRLADGGQYAASLEFALEAVRSEPLRESAHRAVILAHLAEDNAVEALRAYERFRGLLREQLGMEPSENLAHLVFGDRRVSLP